MGPVYIIQRVGSRYRHLIACFRHSILAVFSDLFP